MRNEYELSKRQLLDALKDWDRARAAVGWLHRDFQLIFSKLKLDLLMRHAKQREGVENLRNVWNVLAIKKAEINICQEVNECESLNVGLLYLDKDLSFSLEPMDVPDLSAMLFQRLDPKKQGKITIDSLQQCVSTLDQSIHQNIRRLQELERERVDTEGSRYSDTTDERIHKIQQAIAECQSKLSEDKNILRSIFAFFSRPVEEHIFSRLEVNLTTPKRMEISRLDPGLMAMKYGLERDAVQAQHEHGRISVISMTTIAIAKADEKQPIQLPALQPQNEPQLVSVILTSPSTMKEADIPTPTIPSESSTHDELIKNTNQFDSIPAVLKDVDEDKTEIPAGEKEVDGRKSLPPCIVTIR
jgi:hypothetical protein